MSYVDVIKYAPRVLTTVFIRFSALLIVSLLVAHINSLMLVASLLILVLLLLYWIVLSNLLRRLLCLIMITIYLGAIIILIRYVCAICPNLNIKPPKTFYGLFALPALLSWSLRRVPNGRLITPIRETLIFFIFTPLAYKILLFLLVYIFVVLLGVTTQFTFPQGPFRSA